MKALLLFLKLGVQPFKKSVGSQLLLIIALAQLFFIFTFLGSAWLELGKTIQFSESAKWVGIQIQEDAAAPEQVKQVIEEETKEGEVSVELLSSKKVVEQLEAQEPEVAKALKDMESEGFPLVSTMLIARGRILESTVRRLESLPQVLRIESRPVHHARLKSFFTHLRKQALLGLVMLGCVIVGLLFAVRFIHAQAHRTVSENFSMWGASYFLTRLPLFLSLSVSVFFALLIFLLEWWFAQSKIWVKFNFLGELSLTAQAPLPILWILFSVLALLVWVGILSWVGFRPLKMGKNSIHCWWGLLFLWGANASAQVPLTQQLNIVRNERIQIERALLQNEKVKMQAQAQVQRLKSLQKLQGKERALTQKRLSELKVFLNELQSRKDEVSKRINRQQTVLHMQFGKWLVPSLYQNESLIRGEEAEGEESIRRTLVSHVLMSELKELESFRADLQDADEIQARIEQEQSQLAAVLQDLEEQENLIEFHKKIRESITEEKQAERAQQMERYRELRNSEIEIERMVGQFQARAFQAKQKDSKRLFPTITIRPRSVPWPVLGKVISVYGPKVDERSGLKVFHKGIEILADTSQTQVASVLDGTVQFSGVLPGKGNVLIVEHANDLYTIFGGLQALLKGVGEKVQAREVIAQLERQSPLYFEIRSRNLALDPLKWLQ